VVAALTIAPISGPLSQKRGDESIAPRFSQQRSVDWITCAPGFERYVRLAPESDRIADLAEGPSRAITGREQMQQTTRSNASLFDNLVGEREQVRGELYAKRLSGTEVDREVERGWSLNRKFAILFAFENTADIEPALAIDLGKIDSVTEEAAGQNKIARRIDGGILGWPADSASWWRATIADEVG
jgi:hypothetical protein